MDSYGVDEAADELGQRVAHVIGEVGLGVVKLEPLPGGVAELGQLARGESAECAIANTRQREYPVAMGFECRLDGRITS